MTSRAFHGSKTNSFKSSLTRRRIRKKEVHDFVMQLSPKMLLPLIPCCTQTFFFKPTACKISRKVSINNFLLLDAHSFKPRPNFFLQHSDRLKRAISTEVTPIPYSPSTEPKGWKFRFSSESRVFYS